MDKDSEDRSIPVQDGENNDSWKRSPISVKRKGRRNDTEMRRHRHRNKEKDFLAYRKQESQSKVTKRKKK